MAQQQRSVVQGTGIRGSSIYVGQVDYETTEMDLVLLFQQCGTVVRATILRDQCTGNPKGSAYVEFTDLHSAQQAIQRYGALPPHLLDQNSIFICTFAVHQTDFTMHHSEDAFCRSPKNGSLRNNTEARVVVKVTKVVMQIDGLDQPKGRDLCKQTKPF
jgi:RNA recognition motif-containing protein